MKGFRCELWLDCDQDRYYVLQGRCHSRTTKFIVETLLSDTPTPALHCLLAHSHTWYESVQAKFLDQIYAELARRA